jgi:hypothetical protein
MSGVWIPLLVAALLLVGLLAWARRDAPRRRDTDRGSTGHDTAGYTPWDARRDCGDGSRDTGCDGDTGSDGGCGGGDGGGGD